MMITLDVNADIGESTTPEGAQTDRDILHYVTSCNIACGGHAGNEASMRDRVLAAKAAGVKIGAHPSYHDRENFGRTSHILGNNISATELTSQLSTQIRRLAEIAADLGYPLTHVKPHGALYNDAARNPSMANLIAEVIAKISRTLIFVGAANSAHGPAARQAGLTFIAEGFMDRAYGDDGQIVPRSEPGALITDQDMRQEQLLFIASKASVRSQSGKIIPLAVQTICLHGDSLGAVQSAKSARMTLLGAGIDLQPFAT